MRTDGGLTDYLHTDYWFHFDFRNLQNVLVHLRKLALLRASVAYPPLGGRNSPHRRKARSPVSAKSMGTSAMPTMKNPTRYWRESICSWGHIRRPLRSVLSRQRHSESHPPHSCSDRSSLPALRTVL